MKYLKPRQGYTLIELMVVIAIIGTLATLAAIFLPTLRQSNNSAKAASILQGQLSHAKQRALRDQAPRGIRLVRDLVNPNNVREIVFTEQPPDLSINHNYTISPGTNVFCSYGLYKRNQLVTMIPLDSQQLYWIPRPLQQPFDPRLPTYPAIKRITESGIEPGDYLEFNYGSILFTAQIVGVVPGATAADDHLLLNKALPAELNSDPTQPGYPNNIITNFRIVRQIRPLVGEDSVQLPPNMVVDLTLSIPAPNNWYGLPGITPENDIVFNSSGGLAANGGQNIILYVRPEDGKPDDHALIVIHASTGQIVVHPVAPGADPYYFTRDGRGSGL